MNKQGLVYTDSIDRLINIAGITVGVEFVVGATFSGNDGEYIDG